MIDATLVAVIGRAVSLIRAVCRFLTDSGQVDLDIVAEWLEPVCLADARKSRELGRVVRPGRENGFAAGRNLVRLTGLRREYSGMGTS